MNFAMLDDRLGSTSLVFLSDFFKFNKDRFVLLPSGIPTL